MGTHARVHHNDTDLQPIKWLAIAQSRNLFSNFFLLFFFSFVATFQIGWENICPWRLVDRRQNTEIDTHINEFDWLRLAYFFWEEFACSADPERVERRVGANKSS